MSTLLSFYGAKLSQDGKRLVVTLVAGENEQKQYFNACIKLDNSQKTHAKVEKDGKHAVIKLAMLGNEQKNNAKQNDALDF